MTISLKHAFTSAKSDPADATLVKPSNWNAEHTITCASGAMLGRASVGAGAVEEIASTAYGRSVLNAADAAALLALLGIAGFTTGDIKPTIKTTADSGWVMCNDGTIGNASSGGTTRANADTVDLFTLLWNNVSDTWAPVSGGRGASASADFSANKTIALTKMLGRAFASAGAGSGLTSRALGEALGEETHQLTTAELAAHYHDAFIRDPQHNHVIQHYNGAGIGAGTNGTALQYGTSTTTDNASTGVKVNDTTGGAGTDDRTATAGSDTAHNNMQPTSFVNFMIKL